MSAPEKYELRIGDNDEDGHNHIYITVAGWRNQFDVAGNEYFELSGICKPERAQEIVTALNSFPAAQLRIACLEEVLEECAAYFDSKSDVIDGDYGAPEPNAEMEMLGRIRNAYNAAGPQDIPCAAVNSYHSAQQRIDELEAENANLSKLVDGRADKIINMTIEARTIRKVLKGIIEWASRKCPCHNDEPNPCPLCGASVENLEACKAVESIFPRELLRDARAVLSNKESVSNG